MKYVLYESMEDWCDNGIIFENPSYKFVVSLWCDECVIRHNFSYIEEFESVEEVWKFLQEEEEWESI